MQGENVAKKGLYANIHAKRKRIKAGSNEKMRKPGSKGAPTSKALRKSYCARSAGQMKKFPKAAKDPNSRLRQARKRWKC